MRAHAFAAGDVVLRSSGVGWVGRLGSRVVLGVALLFGPAPLSAGWQSAEDSKSAAELDRLNLDQLFDEARAVCAQRALYEASEDAPGDDNVNAATSYLNMIYPIARHKNGGTVPRWMIELSTAHTAAECQRAVEPGPTDAPSAVTLEPTTTPGASVSEPEPTRPLRRRPLRKKTPAPKRRPNTLEGLPPWLAPR